MSVRSPFGVLHVPPTRAGTIHISAVHQRSHGSIATDSSGCQSAIANVLATMRVPGFMARKVGRSRRFIDGSRKVVTTVASEKSVLKMSPRTKRVRRLTPASARLALRELDQAAVVLDAARAGAALRGRDHQDAVAGTEVDEPILRREPRQVEHLLDQRRRRRHPLDVLARLVQPRRIGLTALLLSAGEAGGHEMKTMTTAITSAKAERDRPCRRA